MKAFLIDPDTGRRLASDHSGGRGVATGETAWGGGELIVPCAGTGVTLLPLTKGGPSKCVSLCNLGLVLGYPERGGIFRCKTRDQGRMSTRYRYSEWCDRWRRYEDECFPSVTMGSRTSLRQ